MKHVAILGSTGSIGTQALEVIQQEIDRYRVVALSCGQRTELLLQQIQQFHPEVVCVGSEQDALWLASRVDGVEILVGTEGLLQIAQSTNWDLLLNALVGIAGLAPTYAAIRPGKTIALANKETLVTGGGRIMEAVRSTGATLLPVDSEHSAIFQGLQGNSMNRPHKIYLTASGGPFRGYTLEQLADVTLEQALKHPNWTMGSKITIDSATMMNKGLEVIEAKWLFNMEPDAISVVVHKESIVHSMVEYADHSVMAQLSVPDMKLPISYAFTYPERRETKIPPLDLIRLGSLSFEPVDFTVFRCLALAYEVLKAGDSYSVVLNAANEVLVQRFLERRIQFLDIQTILERIVSEHPDEPLGSVEDILALDQEIRSKVELWL